MSLFPPQNFGMSEDGVYHSAVPTPLNFSFLLSLGLKTVVVMENNITDRAFSLFLDQNKIQLHVVGNNRNGKDVIPSTLPFPLSEDDIVEAIRLIIRQQNLPALVVCRTGKFLSPLVIAYLRKIEKWSLISILEEYRRFASGSKNLQQLEQFIELYDGEILDHEEGELVSFIKRDS